MENGYLATLWQMWSQGIIEPSHIIKALGVYGYKLEALTNGGITASGENVRFEYKEHITRS